LHRSFQVTIWICLACLVFSGALVTAQPASQVLSPADLAAQLRQIESQLDDNSRPPANALPDQWNIATSEGRYSIPAQPLRALLAAGRLPQARQWIEQMAAQLESYSKPPVESVSYARQALSKILARREFSGVHPPSAWDLLRDRIILWIVSFLQSIFGFAGQHGAGGQVLFWILIAAAVGLLSLWLVRLWARSEPTLDLSRVVVREGLRNSETWLRDARLAAAGGQWRDAIHCAYWAAIARLQETRTLPDDRARTPREYLRLLRQDQPSSHPLRALTLGLERFWYAKQTAGAGDFEESLKHLEALGCRVD